MNVDSVVFDLDGTLWDTTPACARAWNRVLSRHGIEYREVTKEDVQKVTGMPHDDCIRQTFSDLGPNATHILIEATATEDNVEIAATGGELYEGVAEGLAMLAAKYPLYIVSNCQTGYIETFFKLTGLGHHFNDIECFGNTQKSKSHNLKLLVDRNGLKHPVMIGDTMGDKQAADANNIPFLFVSYGFGECPDVETTLSGFSEVVDLLLGLDR